MEKHVSEQTVKGNFYIMHWLILNRWVTLRSSGVMVNFHLVLELRLGCG